MQVQSLSKYLKILWLYCYGFYSHKSFQAHMPIFKGLVTFVALFSKTDMTINANTNNDCCNKLEGADTYVTRFWKITHMGANDTVNI